VNSIHAAAVTALIVAACAAPAAGASLTEQPATMRLDYFHTGGPGTEVFAVDRVVIEPLPWPGNLVRSIDNSNLGGYRFEVVDESGRVVYSRGFASI
jgi:hypothetical protein